jgi:hypothetical protein
MATESTEEHEKRKTLLFREQISFATQRFSKQSLYRALGHTCKIFRVFPYASVAQSFIDFIFPCSSVDSVAIY